MAAFDLSVLRGLENLSLDEAKTISIGIIKVSKTKPAVMNRLVHDLTKAPSAKEVSRIMWQTYMSGTGFGTLNSSWKKHYGTL
jgi:hypothetical protein